MPSSSALRTYLGGQNSSLCPQVTSDLWLRVLHGGLVKSAARRASHSQDSKAQVANLLFDYRASLSR